MSHPEDIKAMAINDFLYLISQGHSYRVAFERAVESPSDVPLVVPSNVRIEVTLP